jgi:hypothetical protein
VKLSPVLRRVPLLGRAVDRILILESGLFNVGYYLERYPDVGTDAITHYLRHGAIERRDPSPYFRTGYYLDRNPDVTAAGINPLVHFILWGGCEGRDPNPYFKSRFYLESYADVRESGANPLAHFLLHGRREGRDPSPRCSARVHLYASCWNEVRLLDFFFRHYDSVVQRYVIYDEGSTDGSLDLLRGHPKVEIRRLVRRDPDSFVLSELDLFNNCWKESRGFRGSPLADWVILCNIDEHLLHPDLGSYLSRCQQSGVTAIPALGYQVFSEEFPARDEHLCKTRRQALPETDDCKLILFSPRDIKEINYQPGGHVAQPEGRLVAPARDEVLLLNYQVLGIDYTLARFAELKTGLGPGDRARQWGYHYGWNREELGRLFAPLAERGVDVAAVAARRWKNCPRPEWWRGMARRHVSSEPPLLSIVTTVYDRADCLAACIQSVKNLNVQDYEHIIVADHPPQDEFSRIVSVVEAAADERISLYNLPSRTNNFGIAPAEFGLKKATGDYVAFLDDDNGFLPNHFDALLECLEADPGVGFAYSSCLYRNERILNASTPALAEIDLGQVLFRRASFRECVNDALRYSEYAWDWRLISDLIGMGLAYRHIDQETFVFGLKAYPHLAPR